MKTKISKIVFFALNYLSNKIGINLIHISSFILSILFSNNVNENLLVFGSSNGKAFSGNSKVVFQYLVKNSDYICVWITVKNDVYEALKNKGYHVIKSSDLIKTIKALKAAKYIFITHGFGDILLIHYSTETKLIHLAHGISFKKGGYDLKKSSYPFFERKINDILAKKMTFLIDSSEQTKLRKMTKFGVKSNKILITGYPRNDILVNHSLEFKNTIKRKLKLKNYQEVFLYAPTFRDYNYKIPLTPDFLEKLDGFLKYENKVLLYKPHPFMEKINLDRYDNVKAVDPLVDINDLLIISDLLITDYSSVFYDYLLTMCPIIFFADDLEKYTKSRGFYFDYKSFVPGPYVDTSEQLLEKIKTIKQWDSEYEDKRKSTRDKFNKFIDGKATERIIQILNL